MHLASHLHGRDFLVGFGPRDACVQIATLKPDLRSEFLTSLEHFEFFGIHS